MAFFSRTIDKLKGALRKTAAVLNTDVRTLFIPGRQIDDAFLTEMEERLLQSDMGVRNVDRNLIRMAVWELTNSDTPPKVVIDEAIELAKEFSTEQSPAFVNGVLDAVLRETRTLTAEPPPSQ